MWRGVRVACVSVVSFLARGVRARAGRCPRRRRPHGHAPPFFLSLSPTLVLTLSLSPLFLLPSPPPPSLHRHHHQAIQHHVIKDKDLIEPSAVAKAAIRGVDRNKYLVTSDPASNLFADVGRAAGEPSRLPVVLAVLLAPFFEIANAVTCMVVDKELGGVLKKVPPTPYGKG